MCLSKGTLTAYTCVQRNLWSLTSGGENCQLTAMSKTRVHPHDDTAPDGTQQQALPKVSHKHGDRLLLCCTCQFIPDRGMQKRDRERERKIDKGVGEDVNKKSGEEEMRRKEKE